ncbi:type II secretion system protein [Thermocrinis sp.]|jgi:type IV pilus assembly protein PilW|uniref:type II secretion system protein n=1 Tax=Thermocrinis sp. TaxID=2024383 RepID=UPI002625A480|nr:type II secretion system protein [Thermocrinis sp.]
MRRKGITLVELLVVMAIVALSAGGIFFAYRSLVRETIRQSLFAKNEQDVEVLLTSLRKDLEGIGFGVPVDRLKVGTPTCNGLTDFAGSNSVVGIAFNCLSGNDELYFLNLATRSFRNSGCWWAIDGSGNVATQGRRWTLEDCPSIPPTGENLLCLDMASKATTSCNSPNTLIFTMGDRTSVGDFAVRYYLSNANLPKECAPNTFNLLKQVNGDSTGRPIASCVAVFRVRYFDGQGYTTNIDDINNLRAIRLCLLMQVGGKMDTQMDPPNRFEQCGDITINPEWRWYRWKLVEEDIPLRNIRK